MRKGAAVKAAVGTMLKKVFVAAGTGTKIGSLTVEFAGKQAYVVTRRERLEDGSHVMSAAVRMPDFCDTAAVSDEDADRVVAIALHELGHAFFTESLVWDRYLSNYFQLDRKALHRAINAFEDPREERCLIDSGYDD